MYEKIKRGSTVRYLAPNGLRINRSANTVEPEYKERTGKAVMYNPEHDAWVLNIGGQHGNTAVVTRQNFVGVGSQRITGKSSPTA